MQFIPFVRANWHLLLFGILLTFFAGFGQTFLFSLFVPFFLDVFSLNSGQFGTFYSAATLCSAIILPWAGALIDKFRLRTYALGVALGMTVAALLISVSHSLIVLFFGILGMRLFGQALMGHTSQTTMARYYDHVRGKALSVASLGHPLGEAVIPISVALLIVWIGWRESWMVISALALVVLGTLIPILLRNAQADLSAIETERDKNTAKTQQRNWTRNEMLRDPRFYFVLPAGLASPFLLTAFFLYQTSLAEFKGWNITLLAGSFIAFALAKSVFSLIVGPMIDKVTARRVYPFILIPITLAFVVLLSGNHPWIVIAYMFLLGVTEGLGPNTKTAMFAELYGVAHLGAIRSTLVSVMVFSTAVAPILMGNLLEYGVSFTHIIYGTIAYLILAMILSLRILPFFDKKLAE